MIVLGALVYLGVVAHSGRLPVVLHRAARDPCDHAAVLVLLEPLVATALASLLLGERLGLLGWAGGILMVVAVVLVTHTRK